MVTSMPKPLPNFMRCKNCMYYSAMNDLQGLCMRDANSYVPPLVLAHWQIEFCFERIKA